MKSINPNDLITFITIARNRSFSRAAAELGVSPSAISYAMRALEEKLAVRLFNRTTRSVALTDAGQRLLDRVQPAFRDIDDALEDLSNFSGRPYGALRINAGLSAVQIALLPLVTRFLAAYPEVHIEIGGSDALLDMVDAGFDAGVRFGENLAQDMIATPISPPLRSALVAAPALIERYAKPAHPQQLRQLPLIAQRFPSGAIYHWEFEQDGKELKVEPVGNLVLSDMRHAVDAAVQGAGFAFAFEDMVKPYIARGELVRVLEDWCPAYAGLFLYYPSRRQTPFALKTFIEFARAFIHTGATNAE